MQVESLKLGWCKLGPGEGAQAVANLLQFNTTIRTLDLRGNNGGQQGLMLTLLKGLITKPTQPVTFPQELTNEALPFPAGTRWRLNPRYRHW